jgi:glyoxylase-like metal-dependent hydrolase (beta-lactamase superfamily II)
MQHDHSPSPNQPHAPAPADELNGRFAFAVGTIGTTILSDGDCRIDGGQFFGRVPRVLWERLFPPDHLNRVPTALNSVLLETSAGLMLIETGYGDKISEKTIRNFSLTRPDGTLLDQLAKLGLAPEDIKIVVNTHLHADHCGWNTRRLEDGRVVPTFPNARYIFQKTEWEAAIHPDELVAATYLAENLHPLQEAGVIDLIEGDLTITPQVRVVLTPGHTVAHQSVWIESGPSGREAAALFSGDAILHGLLLERLAWIPAVDDLPHVSLATKKKLIEESLRRKAHMIVTHHPFPGLGILARDDVGKVHWHAHHAHHTHADD